MSTTVVRVRLTVFTIRQWFSFRYADKFSERLNASIKKALKLKRGKFAGEKYLFFNGSLFKKKISYLYHLMVTSDGFATASHLNSTLSNSIILSVLTFRVISGGSEKKRKIFEKHSSLLPTCQG